MRTATVRRGFVLATACLNVLIVGAAARAAELPPAKPADVGLSSERLARLEAAVQAEVDSGRKIGVVTLIARHGRVAELKAYGMADRESKTAMKTDSLFRLYSMTKPITSVALLMLYEEGKFQLNDPLEKYIPGFKDVKVFAGMDGANMKLEAPKRKPTIQDVFRHTAGFSYGFGASPVDQAYLKSGMGFDKVASLKELVADKLPKVPLLYQPGDQWVYSVSHDVQAYLVEYFSGMPFDKFCRERIFGPLGMKDTTFGVPKELVSHYTANYGPNAQSPGAPLTLVETREGKAPAGGATLGGATLGDYARYTTIPFGGLSISSTAPDYALFAQMLVNGGQLNGVRLLGKKTVELMTANNLPPNIPGIGFAPGLANGATGYGLGVSVLLEPALAGNLGSKGMFGWAGAASTWVVMDPKEELVLLVMAQYLPSDGDFGQRVQTLAYQAIVE